MCVIKVAVNVQQWAYMEPSSAKIRLNLEIFLALPETKYQQLFYGKLWLAKVCIIHSFQLLSIGFKTFDRLWTVIARVGWPYNQLAI